MILMVDVINNNQPMNENEMTIDDDVHPIGNVDLKLYNQPMTITWVMDANQKVNDRPLEKTDVEDQQRFPKMINTKIKWAMLFLIDY